MTIISTQVFAQNLGIGPDTFDPDASAGVEMRFSNKGLLIPRVALTSTTDATTIPSPATSLLVYNLGTGGLSTPGYYYNSGTSTSPNWVRLATTGLDGSGVATRVAFWSGSNTLSSNTNLYWDNTNSRLGVGTSSPAFKLDVRDGAHIATNANTSPFIVSRLYKISNFEEVRIGVDDANLNIHYINDEYQSKINFRIQNTDTENHDGSLASDWTIMTLSATQSGGNVGIGTTSPEAKLHVYTSNINEKSFMSKDNGGAHIFMVPELGSGGYNPMSSAGDVGLIYSGSNGMNTGSIVIGQWSAFARGIKINTDGNVGIGTSTPSTALHVAPATGITLGEDKASGTTNVSGKATLISAGDNAFSTTITTGTQTANVSYTLPTANAAGALINNGSGTLSWSSFSSNELDPKSWLLLGNASTTPGTNFIGTTDAQDVVFKTNNTEKMRITSGGNIGIGTTNPGSNLEVNGTSYFSNTTQLAGPFNRFYYVGEKTLIVNFPNGVANQKVDIYFDLPPNANVF